MPSRSEIAYFGAGPAPLPTAVVEAGAKAFVNYNDSGLGLGEISHRSPAANQILADTKANLTTLLDIPENYEILFLQGGGTGEFSAIVQNLVSVWVERRRRKLATQFGDDEAKVVAELKRQVDEELKLDYIVTGSWSSKAAQEGKRLVGEKFVNVAVDAKEANGGKFGNIPVEEEWKLTKTKAEGGRSAPAFVYFCDNETVDGVEFPAFPKSLENPPDVSEEDERLVVADMSSNFLSRKIDVKKYAVIFGGAQKNVGVTGIALIIVRKDLLPPHTATPSPALLRQLNIGGLPGPIVFDYAITAKNNSLYNTLPIFTLWIAGQVIAGLVQTHGKARVSGQEDIVNKKTALLYGALDRNPQVYQVVPDKSVRSRMNVCFRVHGGDPEKEKEFIAGAEKRLLQGLKGHRSVGGMRASNYNAVSLENVEKLVQYLNDFASA
ncbi:phosphoserine transaminase [Trichophyton rubrum D6]|uniref:phosphoserine transaminase n=4 Tax=Trichophyton TaxID=5550 RepID=A0A178EYH1_TRIRU|nr:phosphoserine transaminase [Trichophyton rubrum CBS 118892]EZF25986.1 phosphoserine transaminase [Trichophyton rubrum MR850]EZF45062.1 phosphoserine transaminase [Trichophyton rubrum CBS 100081]EZF55634.1 phosphoserine transaminase [Trichophyton rubrum CBS 288.86]EZF66299.1 phosphoserine transaminase [Trichophyton rubrum CBS 289.86]EZF76980.1 phosphoserine transaminase [Trichophyton soudanense CBS 452.61]EZF87616.1 phosphoserine transaminase [Trichophyton rubrum MR1448]EZF98437.1 phosphos